LPDDLIMPPAARRTFTFPAALWPRSRVFHISLYAQFGDCLAGLMFGFMGASIGFVMLLCLSAFISGTNDEGLFVIMAMLMFFISVVMTLVALVPLFLLVATEKFLAIDLGTIVWAVLVSLGTGMAGTWIIEAYPSPWSTLFTLSVGLIAGTCAHRCRLDYLAW